MKTIIITTLAAVALITTAVWAQTTNSSSPASKNAGPKQASINACKGLKDGDKCSFISCRNEKRSGTCTTGRRHGVFHCRPDDNRGYKNRPSRPGRGGMHAGRGNGYGKGQGYGHGYGYGRGRGFGMGWGMGW
ncbi:hypothetical protein KKF34_16055 [Myxococcota bacterium]|nr:hypothetical protein [Myxococcota bacterium]MBU1380213.1 hypothetical protein [Myxococcota bacterium]MBU1498391.1 hypothetical protein [Myxococcota bacterium]